MTLNDHISHLQREGFSIVPNLYSEYEVDQICKLISEKNLNSTSVLRSKDLFAIRQLLNHIPELMKLIFNEKVYSLITKLGLKNDPFLSKAIYFDKPEDSNWFVAFHQDLTINVTRRKDMEGFKNWTNKRGQTSVQPPNEYLNRTTTLRIHLDDTDQTNGALRVIPKSHEQGVLRVNEKTDTTNEVTCAVKSGGVMLMKPLILHASNRSTGKRNRRVIHLELCDMELPESLSWIEKRELNPINPT